MDRDVVSRLIYSIIQFLKSQLETAGAPTSSLSEEGAESVEVALQCLETAYGLNQDSSQLSISRSLYQIFEDSVKEEITQGTAPPLYSEPSEDEKAEAERLKNEGNQLMREEKFDKALECYTNALAKDKTNAVYYCNRAAAHSKLNNHLEAIEDCKRALRIEPQYSKAYGRMGLAYSALDKAMEAKECYKKALIVEPENESYRGNLVIAEEKLRTQTQQQQQAAASSSDGNNPFAALAAGGGGAGGFNLGALGSLAGLPAAVGGGPGGPDIQGLFNNPALMNMATQLLSDPNMQNMMSSFLGNITGGPAGGGAPVPPPAPTVAAPPQPQPQPPPPAPTPAPAPAAPEGTSPDGAPAGMEALLTAGRQLAEQMQAQHPELVEQLRSQMNRPGGPNPPSDGAAGNQDPPEPPQT